MNTFRCKCKKIAFELEGDTVIIKCRHCKRYICITTTGIKSIEYKTDTDYKLEAREQVIQSNSLRLC